MKELLNKEIKKGFETKEKYYKNEREIKDLQDKARYFWQDEKIDLSNNAQYEAKSIEYKELDNKIKTLKTKSEILENTINIIKNNLKIQIIDILKNEVFPILKKYANKNIGEKTKEKIEVEIENYFEKNFNIILSFSFWQTESFSNTKEFKISIAIAKSYTIEQNYYKQDYKYFKDYLSIGTRDRFELTLYRLDNAEDISRYDNIADYTEFENKYYKLIDYINDLQIIDFENIDKYAKEIVKERQKTIEKIEKMKKELSSLFDSFNHKPYTTGFLSNNYIDKTRI